MTYLAETLKLIDDSSFIIRSVAPDDAPLMLQYMKIMLGDGS